MENVAHSIPEAEEWGQSYGAVGTFGPLALQSSLLRVSGEVAELAEIVDALDPGSEDWLREEAQSEGYEMTAITRDVDSVITTGTVRWSDGTAGVFTTVTKNNTWLTVDAYTLTYVGTPEKTLTQPLVTRDANGAVIVKPLIVIT